MTIVLVVLQVLADAVRARPAGCGATAPRPSAGRCFPRCRGSPPCRRRSGGGRTTPSARRSAQSWRGAGKRRARACRKRPTTITCSTDSSVARGHRRAASNALRRGDQHADVAVGEDVADLMGAQQRVDRHEYAARDRGRERGYDRLDPLVEVDGHPIARRQAEGPQSPPRLRASRSQSSAYVTVVSLKVSAGAIGPRARLLGDRGDGAGCASALTMPRRPARCRGSRPALGSRSALRNIFRRGDRIERDGRGRSPTTRVSARVADRAVVEQQVARERPRQLAEEARVARRAGG